MAAPGFEDSAPATHRESRGRTAPIDPLPDARCPCNLRAHGLSSIPTTVRAVIRCPICDRGKGAAVSRRRMSATVCVGVLTVLLAAVRVRADEGGGWWSLQPLRRTAPPSVQRAEWLRNPIDAFVLARLEARQLAPAPPADRLTLIRRVTFDLLGLPPTPAEIDAFLQDPSPEAYERLIDGLLASPHYGERWGRHWLDVARFGESQGYERDKVRDHAWRYRDYVICSFNADMPYDQFVREQIAGDIDPATRDGIIATGFLVAGPWDEVGNTQQGRVMKLRVREEELEDIISAVGPTFLGMTIHCARCHNHKFDPIPQRDYYRLKAALEGIRHGDRPALAPAELRAYEARAARPKQQAAELEREIAAIEQNGPGEAFARRETLTALLVPYRR